MLRRFPLLALLTLLTTVWSSTLMGQTLTVLHDFSGASDGAIPGGGLTIDARGRLYGTAHVGGDPNCTTTGGLGCGVVFQLTHVGSSWVLNPLHEFTGAPNDGASPTSTLVPGPDGALYGTTLAGGSGPCSGEFSWPGCGTVFKISPPARTCESTICPWDVTVLHSFTGADDGEYPGYGALVVDNAGNLYGTTSAGGTFGQGTVYELTRSNGAWIESTLYNFTGNNDGSTPYSGVTLDSAGNLYGTTNLGGAQGDGTIFEVQPSGDGWSFALLWTFTSETERPFGGLILDPSGNLFGSTNDGGGPGTVFEMTLVQGSWRLTTIQNLGSSMYGDLAIDQSGNLYGGILAGGLYGYGAIFKLTPSGSRWIYTDLHDFSNSDGANPFGDTLLSNGILYGVTEYGGPFHCEGVSCGVAWELSQ